MQSGGQQYRSIVEENAAGSFKNVLLPETLEVSANVPNWSVFEFCTHHVLILDARWFLGTYSDGRSRTMVHRRGIRHDTDISAWERK